MSLSRPPWPDTPGIMTTSVGCRARSERVTRHVGVGMDTDQSPTFGALLKRHRRAAGLSQEQLAERAGLTAQAISTVSR